MYFLKLFINFMNFIISPAIFIILLLILSLFLYKKHGKIANCINIIVLIIYLLSIPLTGEILIRSLEKKYSPPEKINADVIVMLGGGMLFEVPNIDEKAPVTGSAINRTLAAADLCIKTKLPVILTGGQNFVGIGNESQAAQIQLMRLNIPADKIIIEDKSKTTIENAKNIASILKRYNFKKPVLVTSAFHIWRAMEVFKKQNIECIPYPADYRINIKTTMNTGKFIPSLGGLSLTMTAIREIQGMLCLKFFKS